MLEACGRVAGAAPASTCHTRPRADLPAKETAGSHGRRAALPDPHRRRRGPEHLGVAGLRARPQPGARGDQDRRPGQWRVERDRLEDYIERMYEQTDEFIAEHPFAERGRRPRRRRRTATIALSGTSSTSRTSLPAPGLAGRVRRDLDEVGPDPVDASPSTRRAVAQVQPRPVTGRGRCRAARGAARGATRRLPPSPAPPRAGSARARPARARRRDERLAAGVLVEQQPVRPDPDEPAGDRVPAVEPQPQRRARPRPAPGRAGRARRSRRGCAPRPRRPARPARAPRPEPRGRRTARPTASRRSCRAA